MADFKAENFNQEINSLAQQIAAGIPDIIQILALDSKAKIQDRIQEKGKTSEETSFPEYSPGYKKKRAKNGRQTNHVDLTYTGGMFRRMGIVSAGQQGAEYVVSVGGQDGISQDKIDWNSERYGDIMNLTDKEEQDLEETYNNEIQRIIDEAGFGK